MPNKIKRLYNTSCADYDLHMEKTGHYLAQDKILEKIFNYIEEPILDVACGTGHIISKLLINFSDITGNDFSEGMIQLAHNKLKNVVLMEQNAESIGFKDKKFKTIICCNFFYYTQNYKKAIDNWSSLLEDRGKIILIEEYPFIKPSSNEMNSHTSELMSVIKPLSIKEIISIIKDNNFNLVNKCRVHINKKHDLYGLVFESKH
ncbi:MAG: class I SAM-dependent methyltransferase [bacterium]